MNENEKMKVAVFRFSIISDFVNGARLERGERERLLMEKCARKWTIPFSPRTSVSRSAIRRWIRLYEASGGKLESLRPLGRSDKGESRSIDEETEMALIQTRMERPDASAETLIDVMKRRGAITPGTDLNPSNVYRALRARGLTRRKGDKPDDCRKFEAEFPNDLWQSDVMRGPRVERDGKMKKTYLVAIVDDHSRLIPHAEFYFSERLEVYIDAFEKALLKRGLPRKLYVDNGAAFKSAHLAHVAASLGVALIHARPYKPRGKGKIERWFKTVRSRFLPTFDGRTIEELNEALEAWIEEYHSRKHGSTGQTPFERFVSKMECIRTAPNNLRDHFRKTARRKVAKDRTLTLEGRLFEAPIPLIGKRVELLWHESDPWTVEIAFGGKSWGPAIPVDLRVNCRVKRDKAGEAELSSGEAPKYRGGRLWSGKEARNEG